MQLNQSLNASVVERREEFVRMHRDVDRARPVRQHSDSLDGIRRRPGSQARVRREKTTVSEGIRRPESDALFDVDDTF